MAMGLILPPLKPLAPVPFAAAMTCAGSGGGRGNACRFRLHEGVGHGSSGSPPDHATAPHIIELIDNGLLVERLMRLGDVLLDPDPVVLRLARQLRRGRPLPLRDVPRPVPHPAPPAANPARAADGYRRAPARRPVGHDPRRHVLTRATAATPDPDPTRRKMPRIAGRGCLGQGTPPSIHIFIEQPPG